VSTVSAPTKAVFFPAAETGASASLGCSIGTLEPVLDAYALGEMPEAMKQASIQAHFRTCDYCARLLRAAEDIRSARRATTVRLSL
jgi:hypothetical protein